MDSFDLEKCLKEDYNYPTLKPMLSKYQTHKEMISGAFLAGRLLNCIHSLIKGNKYKNIITDHEKKDVSDNSKKLLVLVLFRTKVNTYFF